MKGKALIQLLILRLIVHDHCRLRLNIIALVNSLFLIKYGNNYVIDEITIQCTRQLNQFTKNGIPLRKLNNSARVIIVGYKIRMKNYFPFHRLCI